MMKVPVNVSRDCGVAQTLALVPGLGVTHYSIPTAIQECFNSFNSSKVITTALSVTSCAIAGYAIYRYRKDINRWMIKYFLSQKTVDMRQAFKRTPLADISVENPKRHSHPQAAADRLRANHFIANFISRVGRIEYSISQSLPEQQRSVAGSRDFYHAKDLQMEYSNTPFDYDIHIAKATDVDYYLDLPSYLDGRAMIISTFVPREAAGSTADATYSFESNEVVVHVNGGATYRHQLWNYETDHFLVDHWWGTAMYLVESRDLTADRKVILLNPIRNIYGPWGWFLPGERPSRRRITQHGFNYITSHRTENNKTLLYHSFSEIGTSTCVTISDATLQSVTRRFIHQAKPAMSDLERILRSDGTQVDNATSAAAILFNIIKNAPQLLNLRDHYKPIQITNGANDDDNHTYQTTIPLVTEDATPSMRQMFPPYLAGFAPGRSYNNDTATVDGRIEKPRCKVKSHPPFYHQCMREFAALLVPDNIVGSLSPADCEFSYEKLKRPTQKSLFESVRALCFLDNIWSVKSFQKAEASAKIAFPRNIATLPTEHNTRLGQFCYPLSDHILKKTSWYLFGLHPTDIAQRTHDLVKSSQWVVPTDYSKMDATTSYLHTALIESIFCRAFAPKYHSEISRLIAKETDAKAFTKYGVRYSTGSMTNSGSSMTSIRNSAINAFNAYVVLRYDYEPTEAYSKLGLYGGDDGLTPNVCAKRYMHVITKMGQVLKAETILPHNPVPLLGRIFIDPWTSTSSIADVPRQLKKLHLTAAPEVVPNEMVLRRRAEGIMITDPDTPILGAWARNVLRLANSMSDEERTQIEKKYKTYLDNAASYTSTLGVWPPLVEVDLARQIVSEALGRHAADIHTIETIMNQATTLEELHFGSIQDDEAITVEVDAAINHTLHRKQKVTTPQKPRARPKQQRAPRKTRGQRRSE